MQARFKSFKRDKTFYLSTRNSIALILLLIFLLLMCIAGTTGLAIDGWLFLSGALLVIYLVYLKIHNFLTIENPRGTFNSDLVFENEQISINGTIYPISEITKIEFSNFNDRRGKYKMHNSSFESSFSHGLDNKLTLYIKNKKKVSTHFLQEGNRSLKQHPDLLTQYYKKGILHFLNLIDILEISKYDEIQKFKKQVNGLD